MRVVARISPWGRAQLRAALHPGKPCIRVLLLEAIALLVLFAFAWTAIAPMYARLLAGLAGLVAPATVALDASETVIAVRYTTHTLFGASWTEVNTLTLQAGFVLLAPVVVLTPGMPVMRRALGLLGVWALLLGVHVGVIGLFAWSFLWSVTGTGVLTLDNLAAIEPLAYIAVPAVVGGAWAWRFWLPGLGDADIAK